MGWEGGLLPSCRSGRSPLTTLPSKGSSGDKAHQALRFHWILRTGPPPPAPACFITLRAALWVQMLQRLALLLTITLLVFSRAALKAHWVLPEKGPSSQALNLISEALSGHQWHRQRKDRCVSMTLAQMTPVYDSDLPWSLFQCVGLGRACTGSSVYHCTAGRTRQSPSEGW